MAEEQRAEPRPGGEEEPSPSEPKFGFKDVIAFTIAAYQILFPILLLFAGALALVYLVFRFLFS
ncbi:MAG: hypothetical protein K6T75_02470 [Acetobacteraceae bacterium]|nr:hypothetical protein [Acetobacteraceae bacterium]